MELSADNTVGVSTLIESYEVINVVRGALSMLDERLMLHGERVAFLTEALATYGHTHQGMELDRLFILAAFHDIGAYKTEEIDNMVAFDGGDTQNHAIYGYLFLRNMTHMGEHAKPILYHHTASRRVQELAPEYYRDSSLIHLADRIDVLLLSGVDDPAAFLLTQERCAIAPEFCRLFAAADRELGLVAQLRSGAYLERVGQIIRGLTVYPQEVWEYLKMMVYAIDFRSEFTVTHTINTVAISQALGRLLGLSGSDLELLYYGAYLHDMGKIAIPVSILEKPGRLTDEEMAVMRTHVRITDRILDGVVRDDIRLIAVRHHEKLDGGGYPYGLPGAELTVLQRVVAVADILSALSGQRSYKEPFPRERILAIISQQRDSGALDAQICNLVIQHYDEVMTAAAADSAQVSGLYQQLLAQYAELKDHVGGE